MDAGDAEGRDDDAGDREDAGEPHDVIDLDAERSARRPADGSDDGEQARPAKPIDPNRTDEALDRLAIALSLRLSGKLPPYDEDGDEGER